MINFVCISPHPPIILPSVGSKEDRKKVKNTIDALYLLRKKFVEVDPQQILIASPHPDWGFQVPLYFLAKDFRGRIEEILIGSESPQFYFEKGAKFPISNFQFPNKPQITNPKIALIASGDLSHCLNKDGPYGFHPDGPKFDEEFLESLKKKDIESILKLDQKYPQAGECGLRPLCFVLGILEASGADWQPEILSYEGPFGVGYSVVNFNLK